MKRFLCLMGSVLTILCFSAHTSAEVIEIVGTGDGVNILKSLGEAFTKQNPGVDISVPESIGSGGAVKSVGGDLNVLGRVARTIKDKEKHFGLIYKPYAKVPVVIVVSKEVPVDNLSYQQVVDIFSGEITNWKDVGGNEDSIKVVKREDGDSSLQNLRKQMPGFKDIQFVSTARTAFSTPENFELIGQKTRTIGFGPFDVAKFESVKILKINGKLPSEEDYELFGTLGLIYKEVNNKGNIKKFIDFATSSSAREAIIARGGSPL
nr:substrate-binding domain-containing protein [Desulfobulbaceae bacterium]